MHSPLSPSRNLDFGAIYKRFSTTIFSHARRGLPPFSTPPTQVRACRVPSTLKSWAPSCRFSLWFLSRVYELFTPSYLYPKWPLLPSVVGGQSFCGPTLTQLERAYWVGCPGRHSGSTVFSISQLVSHLLNALKMFHTLLKKIFEVYICTEKGTNQNCKCNGLSQNKYTRVTSILVIDHYQHPRGPAPAHVLLITTASSVSRMLFKVIFKFLLDICLLNPWLNFKIDLKISLKFVF